MSLINNVPTLKLPLSLNPYLLFSQINVGVYDGGSPRLWDYKQLKITVKSNFQNPQFLQTTYTRTVLETWNISEVLFNVTARDTDQFVSVMWVDV